MSYLVSLPWDRILLGASLLVAVTAAIAAFLAAHATQKAAEATQRAAEATQRAAEAGLLAGFLKDYAAGEMLEALRTLRTWHEQEGAASFAVNWKSRLARGDAQALAVDRARGLVTSYFHNVDRIHQAGLISLNTMRNAVDRTGLGVLFHVVENLERELHPEVDLTFIDRIRTACPERVEQSLIATAPLIGQRRSWRQRGIAWLHRHIEELDK